jgi:hypothetical protein
VARKPETPNSALRDARLRQASPSGSGRAMSRQELAEAVNAYLYAETGQVYGVDANHIGKFERGVIRWPAAPVRTGLRAVLGADFDRDIGFHSMRQPPLATPPAALSELPLPEPASTAQSASRTAIASSALAAAIPPMVIALPAAAVLTVTTDRSGTVRITIETSPPDVTALDEPAKAHANGAQFVMFQRPRRPA